MDEIRDNIPENNTDNAQPPFGQTFPQSTPGQADGARFAQPQPMPQFGGAGVMYNPYLSQPAVKKKTEFTPLETAYSFAAFLLGFLLVRYAVCSPAGFITTGVFIALITAALMFMKRSGIKADGRAKLTAAIGYIFSAVYSITANEFVKALDTVFLCLLVIYLLDRMGAEDSRIPRFLPFTLARAALDRPFSGFGLMPEAVVQSAKKTRLGKNAGLTAAGLVIAIIPTIVVGSLLMSADSGVERMLRSVIGYIFSERIFSIVIQLAIALPVGCYLFGLLFGSVHRDPALDISDDDCELKLAAARKVQNILIYAAVTPICILYLLFFISQASYLLAAFSGTLPEGFSYSEFARRGFFELLAIALINLCIILLINLVAKQGGRNKPAGLKLYSLLIGFFTLVVIASALSKMVMYISVYGLTELRLYTGWFMVLCAFAFIMIMIKQLKSGFPVWRYLTAVFIVMFGLLCFSRPDDIIARYNIEMSRAGYLPEYSDSYLMELSDDAFAVYLEYNGEDLSTAAREHLKDRGQKYDDDPLTMLNLSSLLVKNKC